MIRCKNCNEQTSNPKFCSRSCSTSFHNRGKRRHGNVRLKTPCLCCSLPTFNWRFCSIKCQKDYQRNIDRLRFWLGAEHEFGSSKIKSFLIERQGYYCETCGNKEWLSRPMPLELEHKDGNSENDKAYNLELICPNCHALTPTYKARNKGNGRHYRKIRYKEGKSF